MAFDFKTATPVEEIAGSNFIFGADSQAAATPSIYTMAALITATQGTSSDNVLLNGVTVSSLPGSPDPGTIAYVTDADSPAWGDAVVGSGMETALVWYNGAAWTVIGK